jgi:hypothetical protein
MWGIARREMEERGSEGVPAATAPTPSQSNNPPRPPRGGGGGGGGGRGAEPGGGGAPAEAIALK